MQRRINISLSDQTVALLDRAARRGDRSRLIDAAVRHYIGRADRARLRRRMVEGYKTMSAADLHEAARWFDLENEAWAKRDR